VREAIDQLLLQRISGLPVVDDREQLVGVLTEFALLAIAYDDRICHDKVRKHMTTEVFTVEANDPVSKVADLCIVHRVRRVPVMENGKLIGLIARRDVLRSLYESKAPVCSS
jgi:CBS domain-containing protein